MPMPMCFPVRGRAPVIRARPTTAYQHTQTSQVPRSGGMMGLGGVMGKPKKGGGCGCGGR